MFLNGKPGDSEKEVLLPASKTAFTGGFSHTGGQSSNNVRPRACDETDSGSNPNPRAGFLYTGEGDKVTCPWCRIQLTEWDTYDVPIEEHRRHSPYSDFIKMLFP